MSGYSWISGISIFCYLFLLLSFISSRKKERVIRSFEILLVVMILWTGGSVGMRLQLWPSVYFWHHVSLLGSFMLAYGYYQFLESFLDEDGGYVRYVLFFVFLAAFVFNVFTGLLIPLPKVVMEAGEVKFLYHYTWHIGFLMLLILLALIQILTMIWRHCRGNRIAFHQLTPVIGGILTIFLGNVLIMLPIFVGLPVDMLSGAINAVFLFYALYRKKLFRISILFSKTNYITVSMILGCLIFSDLALVIQRFLTTKMEFSSTTALVIVAASLIVMIALLYLVIHTTLNAVFTHKEKKQKELSDNLSEEITHMLSVNEILMAMTDAVQKVVEVNRLFVLLRGADGDYRIEHTINPLDGKNFFFRADHPLLAHLKNQKRYVWMDDFSRKTSYRSLWESEKTLLFSQRIECAVPLIYEDDLTGFILISGKQGKNNTVGKNIDFIQHAADLCAEAVTNAYVYERAVAEAQKDELTGLINVKFFYEILNREFDKYKDTALSLCIIDIDDFKLYNQMYGTKEGDLALQRVASILKSTISEGSYAARIKGDGFALILPGYDVYSAKCLADNIAEQIETIGPSETNGKITVSIGICAAPYMASSSKELFRNSDTTVYSVKRTGKNSVQIYSADINRRDPVIAKHKSGYSENANTIYALTAAIDAKDHYTFQHSQNVAYYASELAKAAGMTPDLVEIVREAGLLHDIGKIGIREEILNKPVKLTPEEYEIMKGHVENAVNIIRHLPALEYVIPAVRSHHERYDGRGYPRRLSEDSIPITGRILCVADSFDAITAIRNYKVAVPVKDALAILRSEAGKQFDPHLVEIFCELVENGKIELRDPVAGTMEEAITNTSSETNTKTAGL